MAKKFVVDIPDRDGYGTCIPMGQFNSREEAIAFAEERFGADKQGKICLVSSFDDGNEEEE